jgi:hypothetical protein
MAIKIEALPILPSSRPEGQSIRQALPEWRMIVSIVYPCTTSPHGLLAHILTEEEYLHLHGVVEPAPPLRLPPLAKAGFACCKNCFLSSCTVDYSPLFLFYFIFLLDQFTDYFSTFQIMEF